MRVWLALPLIASVAFGVAAQDVELEPEPEDFDPIRAAIADRQIESLKLCDTSPSLVLNEVCSVGTECDEDVRVSDFVELYNPSGGPVDLSCFVLINRERVVFIPRGELASGKVRAWGEAELGFRITKADDEIELLKLGTDGTAPSYHTLETLPIREDQSHSFRVPDGGTWRYLELDEAEAEWPGSFNEPNPES